MKKVDREEFTRILSRVPVHLRTVVTPGNAIEYYSGMQLVGVYVKSQPVRRLLSSRDEIR